MKEIEEILKEANKCLNCKNPKCRMGCPVSTNIPDFIKMIKEEKIDKAYEILQENNLMSEICSLICPVENQCIGNCVKGIKGEPVQINRLESFVNMWAMQNNINYKYKIEKSSNISVAVIGAGPAGLACAIDLKKAGANVTIFEREKKCGGILEYGIPNFRLNKNILERLIHKIEELGINIKTNIEFGKDITIQELKSQGYDYIFLAIGLDKQNMYKLTNEQAEGIFKSDEILKAYNCNRMIKNLGTVVVIGGGNVAIDSARTAKKMGAKEVYILYRRNQELMPARKSELEDAILDGVQIIYQTKVLSANTKDGKINEIECIKTKIEDEKAIDIENSNFKMKADTIIFAIGAKANEELFSRASIVTENGYVAVDENYKTNIDYVYAGGDLVEKKPSVCKAIATGKKVASAILTSKK